MKYESEPWHEDAKLSTAQRKKLKSSTFCGPNRSFPVPDCAHVTAARRLIGRAKVSDSTKSKILACVSRKSKQLGCGGDSLTDSDYDKMISSEEFDDTRELLAFLEHVEEDKSIEEKQKDFLKTSLATLLDKLRSNRLGIDSSTERATQYSTRTLDSIVNSIIDEL